MVSQIIKQAVVAVALAGALGSASAAVATSTVTGVTGVNNYTFMDLSSPVAIAIADLTLAYDVKTNTTKLFFSFFEGGNVDQLQTNATSLTVYYWNGPGNSPSSKSYTLSGGLSDRLTDERLGGNGATFAKATLNYTYTPIPAVPEPESYAMLLAGLGLLGAVTRRRNKGKSD